MVTEKLFDMAFDESRISRLLNNLLLLYKNVVLGCLVIGLSFFLNPIVVQGQIIKSDGEDGHSFVRSLETLRDLEYQSWQVVAYLKDKDEQVPTLRIVGYPGQLRLDHPTNLKVTSGRKTWVLTDITLLSPKLSKDPRSAAAEFDLSPVLLELINNRPLRLQLDGVFNELPIPPYLVSEWRSLIASANS